VRALAPDLAAAMIDPVEGHMLRLINAPVTLVCDL
jgi:hypothetical protein